MSTVYAGLWSIIKPKSNNGVPMIKKNDLLEKLSDAAKMEGALITIYSNHLNTVLGYSRLDQEIQSEITFILKKLIGDSKRHDDVMNNLIASISNSGKNVY
jgi:hypothetical protein